MKKVWNNTCTLYGVSFKVMTSDGTITPGQPHHTEHADALCKAQYLSATNDIAGVSHRTKSLETPKPSRSQQVDAPQTYALVESEGEQAPPAKGRKRGRKRT